MTRWTLAATIPVLLVLAVLPGPVLHIFGGKRGYGPDGLLVVKGVLYGVTTWGGPDYRPRADDSLRS